MSSDLTAGVIWEKGGTIRKKCQDKMGGMEKLNLCLLARRLWALGCRAMNLLFKSSYYPPNPKFSFHDPVSRTLFGGSEARMLFGVWSNYSSSSVM